MGMIIKDKEVYGGVVNKADQILMADGETLEKEMSDVKTDLTSTESEVNSLKTSLNNKADTSALNNKVTGFAKVASTEATKILTYAKTLPMGMYSIGVTTGTDKSELPNNGAGDLDYGLALVTVRSQNDMINVLYFGGVTNELWVNMSNNGTFKGWKKIG